MICSEQKTNLYKNELKDFLSGKNLNAVVETYGCQQNAHDSEILKGMLKEIGYTIIEDRNIADVILFNTCAIRKSAEDKVFGNIGELKHVKEKNKDVILGICGCMTEQEDVSLNIKEKYPFIDIIFGTNSFNYFYEYLWKALIKQEKILNFELDLSIAENLPVLREDKFRANITVMYGCNNFCSYCIVPYVRGRERSRKPEYIINEINELINEGYREFTLLGQNVNSYGKDLEEKIDFPDLLKKINDLKGDFKIRFLTSHPKDATHKLIDIMAECKKVCRHLHLPVQSGSDKILKLMNRHYDIKAYLELINYAKLKINNLAFTSDIIVGFPDETEEDFNETLRICELVRYDNLYTFIYSKRDKTPAAVMENQVPENIKHERFDKLVSLQTKITKEINDELYNKEIEILVTGFSETNDKMLSGRTESNKTVNFKGDESFIGKYITIKIIEVKTWSLLGEIK